MVAPRFGLYVPCLAAALAWGCEVPNPAYDLPVVRQHNDDGSLLNGGRKDADFDGTSWMSDASSMTKDATLQTTDAKALMVDARIDAAVATAQADLVAYWAFDEGTTSFTNDQGSMRMQTQLQGATWTTDIPSVAFPNQAALQFDGIAAEATTPGARLDSLANPFTISVWCRPERSAPGTRETLVTLSQPEASRSLHLGRYRDGRLAVWTFGGVELVAGPVPTAGEWQHVAYTWDGTASRIWLRGMNAGSSTKGPGTTSPTLVMFAGIPSGEYYAGVLDEVRIYKRALGAFDIAVLAKGAF